jgi:lipoate-protein ligase A
MASLDSPLPCRLMIDPPASGAWHMAVDQVLLETAAEGGPATLRFYAWSEATLSLGYFQSYSDRAAHRASRDCPLVRRQTGGGAIVHDAEVTYSLAIGAEHPGAAAAGRLYDVAHQALADVLVALRVDAYLLGDTPTSTTDSEPFLCFERRARGDVMLGNSKVCGSAQRRHSRAILQHGSLLLAQSDRASELPGIRELAGKSLPTSVVIGPWRLELATRLRLDLFPQGLSDAELARVRTLAVERYDTTRWNKRR